MRQIEFGFAGCASRSVIGAENDQRVVGQSESINRIKNFTNPVVRVRKNRSVNVVLFFKFFESPTILGYGVKRRVRFVHPKVDEKGLVFDVAFFDEGNGVVCVFVDRHLFTGAIECPVLVIAILGRSRRIRNHVVRQMPFAKMRGIVSGSFEESLNRRRVGVQPVRHVPPGI